MGYRINVTPLPDVNKSQDMQRCSHSTDLFQNRVIDVINDSIINEVTITK